MKRKLQYRNSVGANLFRMKSWTPSLNIIIHIIIQHWFLQAPSACRLKIGKCAAYNMLLLRVLASQYVCVCETDNFMHAIFVVQVFTINVISSLIVLLRNKTLGWLNPAHTNVVPVPFIHEPDNSTVSHYSHLATRFDFRRGRRLPSRAELRPPGVLSGGYTGIKLPDSITHWPPASVVD
jgi:hypothetical protein